VRLFEHPDFDQVILQAAEHFQLRPGIIEKDYYVTEVLRIIAATAGDKVIFKGGTSLSKGWNLIQRFSEDIDIYDRNLQAFHYNVVAWGKQGHFARPLQTGTRIKLVVQAQSQPDNIATLPLLTATFVRPVGPVAPKTTTEVLAA